ncbi:PAS domain-containing sensor histidine kinase [Alkalilimnicola ehrlichii]|uniref:histidine kinase n=1 Tax=Alkalilimnicola ehrlichii TaxID=351052 RepID=A0A3E0WSC6_9GAMM|nr:PAS domain-containing sensor histidine kinase [Alkalilimnicola ehrlichii]RFA28593.1 PAS domain-containing sensor histidine kinase [Alkalilimnicola ehrlichii]RFA35758.1 PAS domain-containing sensor histidine kinase [Alkalilimnicola ehrlichii]
MKIRTPEEGLSALTDDAERNRLLAEMAEQSTDMISRHTPDDWRFIYASPAVERLLGFTVEEIVGQSAYDLYHPDDVEDFKRRSPKVTYDKGLYTHTYRFRCKDGHYTWLESTSRTIRCPETGEIREILVVSRDATHRIKADEANRRLARVLESTQDLVIFVSLGRTVTHLNEAARTTLGLDQEDYKAIPLSTLIARQSYDRLRQEALPLAESSGHWRGELQMQARDGRAIPVMLELLAHRSLHGDIEYYSLVAHDLSDEKLAEEQLKQYQADIDHASRLITMGELASSLAHELNQPLSALVNFLRGVERRFSGVDNISWESIRLPIQRSISTAMRAGEIVHRMMDFTRKQGPKIRNLNIADVLDELIEFSQLNAERRNVSLQTDLAPDLPPVRADKLQLEQILLNLVINAIEASARPPDQEPARVTIAVEHHDRGQLKVMVTDQGPGIAESDLPRIFERFYSTKDSGLGMGLAISRSLVEGLGGEIWVDNLPAGGACFTFTLNVAD